MVSKSKICLICKQDSKNLNSIDSTDVQIVFKQNATIDVCNSCWGKFELILQFLKSIKKSKQNKSLVCSICTKVSLYLFNLNEKNKNLLVEKIDYCEIKSIHPLKNICHRCLYLTDLWYDLKKQYTSIITDQVESTPLISKKMSSRSGLKRVLSLSRDISNEISQFKLSNKKRKSDTSIKYGGSEEHADNSKLKNLQRKLQLDIRDSNEYLNPTKSRRRRHSTDSNSIISITDSLENISDTKKIDLKPAKSYFTNRRKKWLKSEIKSDSKLLNTICRVDLSCSLITDKVLKRLRERSFVRVKAIASDVDNNEQQSEARSPRVKNRSPAIETKTKKFTAARKFPKTVPKTKRNFQSELEEIHSSTINSSVHKSSESDPADFDYGINRHTYDAFSTDKEKVVMVLLHNVDQFEKKSQKPIPDDNASVTSTSSDEIDEDEQRLGRFACLENYMKGLPHLIINRMDSDVLPKVKVNKKNKRITFKDVPKDGDEEFITPERNPSFDEIRIEIEKRVRERVALQNLNKNTTNNVSESVPKPIADSTKSSESSNLNNLNHNSILQPSSNAESDGDVSTVNEEEEPIELHMSEEDSEKQTQEADAVITKKSQTNNNENSIEIDDDSNDIICLDQDEETVEKRNGDITNNSTQNDHEDDVNDEVAENTEQDEVQCNVEITTANDQEQNEDENTKEKEVVNKSPMKENQFCEVAQKLAELDA